MAKKQAYKNTVEIAFVGSKYVNIEREKIVYIIIEHMYEARFMPIIYISISVDADLYNTILSEKDSAKIFLRIQKYDAYSNTSLNKDYIKKQFTYFLPSVTPEYTKDLSDFNTNVDSNYRTMVIGLMDMDIMNTYRKTFGGDGVKKNIDQHNLVYMAVEDTKIVIKDPTYNLMYDELYIPPLTSRKELLDFAFNKDPFYDTEFLYFIDFETSYLLDRTGEAVNGGDGQLDDVIIDVKAVTMADAYNEGMEIQNGSYYFYVNPANANVSMNVGREKVANQLVTSYNDSGTTMIDLNINNSAEYTTKQSFKRMKESSTVVYKNAVESAQVCIEIVKENLDARYITPNKSYNINNYEGYSEYNGKYLLLYKKEVIHGASEDFASILTIGVRKVGNIQHIGMATMEASHSSTKSVSSTAQGSYSSTKTTKTSSTKATTSSSSPK